MRSSPRSIAALVALALLIPAAGVLAEDADVDSASSDGSQIAPAGPDTYTPKAGNLNSVPEDGTTLSSTQATDSPLVKQILASRPNEDLVICIAGCYSGANRVIFAQPSTAALRGTLSSQPLSPGDMQKQSLLEKPSRAAAATDPRTPIIINPTN
jgi:hypothetical protein